MSEVGGWSFRRFLLVAMAATAFALGVLFWARPSIFTGIVVVAGLGQHLHEPLADSFYALRVASILEKQCAGCHGPRLQRARLRLDSLGNVKLGGKSGAVVKAGKPLASELYTRLLLPPGDKRAMPGGSKPPLSKDEIKVIELWIASGASGDILADAIQGAPPPPSPPVMIEPLDLAAVEKARAPLRSQLAALIARYPNAIEYQARNSDQLAIDMQRLGKSFGDTDLARLEPLAAAVTRLDLSGTAITDAAVASLTAFERVEVLRLNDTNTGDALLTATAKMRELRSLTLLGTRATPGQVARLRERGVRVHDARD